MTTNNWDLAGMPAIRHQQFFGDRLVKTFAERPANFDALLRETSVANPDCDALAERDRRLSYRELDAALSSVAFGLREHGIVPGDRVGILCDNGIDGLLAILGTIRAGAVAVPMGTRQQGPEIEYVINDCGMTGLVFDASLAERLPHPASVPSLRLRVAVGGKAAGSISFGELAGSVTFAPVAIAETDPAVIMYTSGTTGKPKGAVLPHVAMVHTAMHFVQCLGHGNRSRALLTIPASHISGLGAVVMAMLRAGGCVVIDGPFKARSFLEIMAGERITFTVLVPAMYKLMLLEPDFDASTLRAWQMGLFGGAVMPPATIAELAEKLPWLQLINAYGSTETTSPATIMPAGRIGDAPDSIGWVVPCGDIRVMDEEGREVDAGRPGELWIGGPMIASRYWNNDKASAENFTAGYWHSGDIGTIDAGGFVRILDRKKDMINRAGYKVYSAEVENILSQHPSVVESVVVGKPDAVLGERVHAFVRIANADAADQSMLSLHCAAQLADYKVPESWTISTEPLPRNANGKFEKRKLARSL